MNIFSLKKQTVFLKKIIFIFAPTKKTKCLLEQDK